MQPNGSSLFNDGATSLSSTALYPVCVHLLGPPFHLFQLTIYTPAATPPSTKKESGPPRHGGQLSSRVLAVLPWHQTFLPHPSPQDLSLPRELSQQPPVALLPVPLQEATPPEPPKPPPQPCGRSPPSPRAQPRPPDSPGAGSRGVGGGAGLGGLHVSLRRRRRCRCRGGPAGSHALRGERGQRERESVCVCGGGGVCGVGGGLLR